ncbi:glutathione peroxidase [Paucibacter sp. KBW04]|uniref:glutathione peroxidase n=1 Tax=Paucibacter sp. KBW04 TaxID=2153361 RepID=UPI000F589425|nr:glutathione peroxidase [Paucibacter sp. KBW04]RQO54815.1 glutathione peroxidase [Paucibacter sp. KBW04]
MPIVLALLLGLSQGLVVAAANASTSTAPAKVDKNSDKAATPQCPALLQRVLPRLQDEQPQALCQYAGRVLLVVNTASFCGYTSQYQALEQLQARYAKAGLVVLGFPSNDFGSQEPGSNKEIAEFCQNTFNVKFPMFAKSAVLPGRPDSNPLFADLGKKTGQTPQWNFHKYLISRDGQAVQSIASKVDPLSPDFIQALERLLAQP